MTRAVQLSAALLLAGLALVSLPREVWAQNSPWRFSTSIDPITDEPAGTVLSVHFNGGRIIFTCEAGDPRSKFLVRASTGSRDEHPRGEVEVVWRIDDGKPRTETWEADWISTTRGVGTIGQSAYEFALAVARAQVRIVLRNINGTAIFNTDGSTKAISQLLELCGLEE